MDAPSLVPICCICEQEPADFDVGPSESGERLPVCEHCMRVEFEKFFAPAPSVS